MIGMLPMAVVGVALIVAAQAACAATITITAAADATLFEDATGQLANGSGTNLFAGRTTNNNAQLLRRALVRFDLSALPPGAVVTAAQVSLSLTRSRFAGDLPVDLHRVTAPWSEGPSASAQGAGEPAQPGDTTWRHRSYPTVFWTQPGGDHVATVSSTRHVGGTGGPYLWPSTAQLVADVQGWVADPASNHGWLVRGFEGPITSAKAFATRESSSTPDRPLLILTYDVPPPAAGEDIPLPGWALALLGIGLVLGLRKSRMQRKRAAHLDRTSD